MHTIRSICAPLLLCLCASPLAAQRNEATLEGSFTRGTIGYARHQSPKISIGIELGFGFPQLDRTLSPRKDPDTGTPSFEEYLHVAPFVRYKVNRNFEIDAGLRAGFADMWPCGASDCWPAGFIGTYVQPMAGWRRVKFGARLTAGVIAEGDPDTRAGQGDESTAVVSLAPLLVRASFPW